MQSCSNTRFGKTLRHTVHQGQGQGLPLFRLVEGSNLSKHLPTEPQTSPAKEPWMLNIAAQLVDVSVKPLCNSWLQSWHNSVAHAETCMLDWCAVCGIFCHKLLKCVIAVQTLWRLHCGSNFCHLDLSPDNIMLRSDKSNPWDTLRLIDFGFAANFNPGKLPSHACVQHGLHAATCPVGPDLPSSEMDLRRHFMHCTWSETIVCARRS